MTERADFEPSAAQRQFFYDDRRFLYFSSGRGCGKTTAACWRLAGMIEREQLKPGARVSVFGPTYPQLMDGTVKTFDRWMGEEGFNLITRKRDGNRPQRWLVRGIEVTFRNASNPDQTRSRECQVVWLDEAAQMTGQILPLSSAMLRQFGQDALYQTIITSTPRGRNWLWKAFVDQNGKSHVGKEKVGLYQTTTEEAEQSGIARSGYIGDMGYAPGSELYRQEVLGEFVWWAGLVFEQDWQQPDPFIVPDLSPTVGGIDFGLVAPSAITIMGRDARGAIWDVDEFYRARCDFGQLLSEAVRLQTRWGVQMFYADAANPELIATMRKGGLRVVSARKRPEVATGWLNTLIRQKRYFLAPTCHFSRMELGSYQYRDRMSGDEHAFTDKVKPGQADHLINAKQYAALGLAQMRAPGDTAVRYLEGSFR